MHRRVGILPSSSMLQGVAIRVSRAEGVEKFGVTVLFLN
jgi:hypothetical protein